MSEEISTDPTAQLAFLTTCNLATRLGPYAPNIDVYCPEATPFSSTVYSTGASLGDQAMAWLRGAIDTSGLRRKLFSTTREYDLAIHVGRPVGQAKRRLFIGWNGWLGWADTDYRASHFGSTVAFGALVAAALGVARLHHASVAFAKGAEIEIAGSWRLNSLSLNADEGGPALALPISIPRLLLVGAGALGCTFAYAMAHQPGIRVVGDIVDDDVLTMTNSNRQITATYDEARVESVPKVDNVGSALTTLTPCRSTYEQFKQREHRSAGDYELVITGLDNVPARRDVASDLPRLQIDGATGSLLISLMRASDPSVECLRCQYEVVETDETGDWSRRLGLPRSKVERLRDGVDRFDDPVVSQILADGTIQLDDEECEQLQAKGWPWLTRRGCGGARPDRGLPTASVSYVSATCGFLMASQTVAQFIADATPGLRTEYNRWEWDMLAAPSTARSRPSTRSQGCIARHDALAKAYRRRWR